VDKKYPPLSLNRQQTSVLPLQDGIYLHESTSRQQAAAAAQRFRFANRQIMVRLRLGNVECLVPRSAHPGDEGKQKR